MKTKIKNMIQERIAKEKLENETYKAILELIKNKFEGKKVSKRLANDVAEMFQEYDVRWNTNHFYEIEFREKTDKYQQYPYMRFLVAHQSYSNKQVFIDAKEFDRCNTCHSQAAIDRNIHRENDLKRIDAAVKAVNEFKAAKKAVIETLDSFEDGYAIEEIGEIKIRRY
jgi:hypothetical protein